jgi:hypothetical protein
MVEGQECRGVYRPEKDGSVCRNMCMHRKIGQRKLLLKSLTEW